MKDKRKFWISYFESGKLIKVALISFFVVGGLWFSAGPGFLTPTLFIFQFVVFAVWTRIHYNNWNKKKIGSKKRKNE